MRGEGVAENSVTGVVAVTATSGLRQRPQQLRQLRQLRFENGSWQKSANAGVSEPATEPIGGDFDAIEERAALVSETCPAPFVDAFARLNHQKPSAVSAARWRLALDDGGRFLDAWGPEAAALRWTPGDLFDAMSGLVWRLTGECVEAIGEDHFRLSDGRTIRRIPLANEFQAT